MIPLWQDILDQPGTLAQATDFHFGEGQPALLKAAERMQARRVVLSGMGSSLFACYPLCNYLAARGVAVSVVDSAELLHYQHLACRDAAVVLVSRSGESVEVTKLLSLLQEQKATIIGVTNEPGSALAHQAHHIIMTASRADQAVAVQTYTATLVGLYLLGAAVVGAFDAARRELQTLIAAMEASLRDWVAASETWSPFFDGAHCVYLLARGASVASALEGALLFHEVAKFPAVTMGAGMFRHGPVEVVDERFRALIFAPNDAARELNRALARDLNSLGGQAKTIGVDADWHVPDAPAALAPVVEIVPVQLAALRLAERRGIEPGKFRFATQVTQTEAGFSLEGRRSHGSS